MRRTLSLVLCLGLFSSLATAGTHGILEGTVKDRRTGERLPGATVVIVGLQMGASTDSAGHFKISNVRAGRYEVRCTLVGYRSTVIRNVAVNPDLRTSILVELESSDVQLSEITVFQEKPVLQKDVTSTTYQVPGEELLALPIDRVPELLRFKPGITAEGNVRGGRSTELVYLVDGLPVQDALGGGIGVTLPMTSVGGLTLTTGGFEAQYGNALSGVVNIVTRTGTDRHSFFAQVENDNACGLGINQSNRTTQFELSAAGPIALEKAYYAASLHGYVSGTRWWQDFRYFFEAPNDRLYSGFAKVNIRFTPLMQLELQGLYSGHNWRDYEFNWRYDLSGLPPERQTSNRLAAILSHTLSQSFFYTASISRYELRSEIGDGSKSDVSGAEPYQYDFELRYIVDGKRAWWSRSRQQSYTAKFDGTVQAAANHLFRFGAEATVYELTADMVKYEPRKTFFGKPLVGEPPLDFSSNYTYRPWSGSLYAQSKIDLLKEGLLFNLGLRYDIMNPTASRPQIESIPVNDSSYVFNVMGFVPASVKQQVSPRIGVSMPFSEKIFFYINLGWYFQFPLFDYLYRGLDRVSLARGISAITGNPDLNPERSQMWEFGLKYTFPLDVLGSITYFRKETRNLVDTKTFIAGDSKAAGNYGFAEFVNTPYALASGVEIVLSRDRGTWLTGEISYTFMKAEASSGSSYDGYYTAQFGIPPSTREYPLSWDQRHTVKALLTVTAPTRTTLTTAFEYHTGRPYTYYPTSTGYDKIVGGAFSQNNARMPAYTNIDIKLAQVFTFGASADTRLTLYLDSRNLLNAKSVRWVDSNGVIGGELGDPSGYFTGRRTNLGLRCEF